MVKVRATRSLENAFRRWGFHLVAGCDEVGRGCLAGPVMAGAVILDPARHIPGLFDSKMTTALERERLYDVITRRALAWAVASASPGEIDRINIHRAPSTRCAGRSRCSSRCPTWWWWTRSRFPI
jgi:hypothetical protein